MDRALAGNIPVIHTAAFFFNHWLFHPLVGRGYQFWSGIAGCFVSIGLLGGLLTYWRVHNCHVPRCPFIAWHPHPDHGHPVCRWHHPHHRNLPATSEDHTA